MLSILSGLDSASLNLEIDGFALLFVCVSLNLVTCVFFYLIIIFMFREERND